MRPQINARKTTDDKCVGDGNKANLAGYAEDGGGETEVERGVIAGEGVPVDQVNEVRAERGTEVELRREKGTLTKGQEERQGSRNRQSRDGHDDSRQDEFSVAGLCVAATEPCPPQEGSDDAALEEYVGVDKTDEVIEQP